MVTRRKVLFAALKDVRDLVVAKADGARAISELTA
jgi:hypothetical protein